MVMAQKVRALQFPWTKDAAAEEHDARSTDDQGDRQCLRRMFAWETTSTTISNWKSLESQRATGASPHRRLRPNAHSITRSN